jgi:hypothetical protein
MASSFLASRRSRIEKLIASLVRRVLGDDSDVG